MRKLSWFNKTVFFFNIVLAVLTVLAYILPFLAPKLFPILSVLTLFLPLFLILNALFFLYWLFQLRRQIILSALMLLLGITFISKFYKFAETNLPAHEQDFTVMSYNVRLFNLFYWIKGRNVPDTIRRFVNEQNPHILCIQEFSPKADLDFKAYRHRYISMHGAKIKTGQAIFSKFPIINSGDIVFPRSNNNAAFADIKKGPDTIRVYSIHLESVKITPDVNELNQDIQRVDHRKSGVMLRRISKAFKEQQLQAEIIMNHKKESPYPVIICGDMNNSAFSYVYRIIRGNLDDAFEEAGTGFGQTYNFRYYPARIDYIFTDPAMKVKEFKNFSKFKNSDHYPVMTRLFMD
jgi:endonuclease/exonuclease/phosphatase family metal-dependent hydrolase